MTAYDLLKKIQLEYGYSYRELAEKTKISRNCLININLRKDKLQRKTIYKLIKFANDDLKMNIKAEEIEF